MAALHRPCRTIVNLLVYRTPRPMCGILFLGCGLGAACDCGSQGSPAASPAASDWRAALQRRGPDAQGSTTVHCGSAALHFYGSLLQLRGHAASTSPLADVAGSVLLFNGQVFDGLAVPPGASDAQLLLQALGRPGSDVPGLLTGLRGPWALVYWHARTLTLWFGRDPLGRRSLLLHRPRAADARLVLASVAPLDPGVPFEGFEELPPGLYSLQLPGALPATAAADGAAATAAAGGLSSGGSKLGISIARHEWADEGVRRLAAFWRAPELVQPPAPDAADAGSAAAAAAAVAPPPDPAFEATVDAVLSALRQAVATRCRCIDERPPCTAAVAAAAGAPGSPRSAPVPLLPPAPVLVLFSGGVDSTLLAALAHEALPEGAPIDLACVCFDAGASPDRQSALDALRELRAFAPSRLWRLLQVDCSLDDVAAARPRLLRLLAPADTVMDLNIGAALWLAARGEGALLPDAGPQQAAAEEQQRPEPRAAAAAEAATEQERRQRDAAAPPPPAQQAAGGPGTSAGSQARCTPPQRCRSAARVVLLGHGADELLAGYGRHRTAFRARGWEGLGEELGVDLRRLWLRNLGRDDRLVADHGREARHPFLDEGVVAAALAAPLPHLADLRLPPGRGDKRVLRACLLRLGLPRAAARAKRAIQFGTRLAAQTNTQQFGGTRRANLLNAGSVRLADVGM